MVIACKPCLCSSIGVNSWIRPNQNLFGNICTTGARTLGLQVWATGQGLGLLEIRTEIYGYRLCNDCDFFQRTRFWSLSICNDNCKVRQEDSTSEAEPHKPTFDEDRRNYAHHTNGHSDEVFHHSSISLRLSRFPDCGDALGFFQGDLLLIYKGNSRLRLDFI